MKKILILLITLPLLLVSSIVSSQDLDIAFYADAMVNAFEGQHRVVAAEQFSELFIEEIQKENSFHKNFDELKFVSIQYPIDTTFRIFSWQVKESEDDFRYHNVIQLSDGNFFELNKNEIISNDDTDLVWDAANWPNQLIYNIKETKHDGADAYIIFGLQQENRYIKTKVADVLTFSDGQPNFGAPIFIQNPESQRPRRRHRLVLSYGADANASLNYNPNLELIVYDHLIQRAGMMPGQGIANYPDGSYEAYQVDGEKWVYIEKLFHNVLDEAPRPKPVKSGGGVFGSKQKTAKKRKQ